MKRLLIILCLTYAIDGKEAVLILARGGSKGIHLKNLQKVGSRTLIATSINTAKEAGFQDITVSTDHPLIALEAFKYNVSVCHRSAVTATDWAPSIWGVSEFLNKRVDIQVLILIQTTSPFIKPIQINQALYKLTNPVPFDCVFSVARSFKLRWKHIDSVLTPANFNVDRRPRRQDWNGEYVETGSFYIFRRELVAKGHLQNNK